jgi:ABC-type multidrug transport system ATPase subunit
MCALMGASGAGKSTLLDILAQRKTTGEITGEILYNDSTLLRSTAYVMQDNVHIGLLTVKQSLYFAAQLRLPEHWTQEKKEKRVEKILDMLGLTEVANTLVGNHEIRGISGGQLKRLSIGVEIVNLPNLMFLDEPTTGLDSSISLEVMSAVRNLANQNRTVICTIHQPSHQTFDLFDTLLLLAKGRVIYFGPVNEAIDYFQNISSFHFHYRPGTNPADYVIAVGGSFIPASDGRHVTGDELANFYMQHKNSKPGFTIDPRKQAIFESGTLPVVANALAAQKKAELNGEDDEFHTRAYNTSTWHQIKIMCHRNVLKTMKDRRATVTATAR